MHTKKVLVIVMTLAGSTFLSAQSGLAGRWAATGKNQPPISMEFKSSGATLAGTVRLEDHTVDILDGKVSGNRVTFKVTVPSENDSYAMMFSGRRAGDKINFKCNVEVNPPGEKVTLGPACLQAVTVRRVAG